MKNKKRKRQQAYRPRVPIPCWCFVCAGKPVDVRTVKEHNARPRSAQVAVVEHLEVPLAVPDSVEEVEPNEQDAIATISPDTLALLEAYDEYFLHTFPDAEAPLYTDSEDEKSEEDDAPPTVGNMVMMHLDWMSTFHNSGQTD
jgi:hypothetical protein